MRDDVGGEPPGTGGERPAEMARPRVQVQPRDPGGAHDRRAVDADRAQAGPGLGARQVDPAGERREVRQRLAGDDLDAPPALGDADMTLSASDFRFDRIRIAGAEGFSHDEIRIGTTFASVAPVPEPSSLCIFASGAIALAIGTARRRRRVR